MILSNNKARMSKIIAIVNQKGGVGKTTTAINLSAVLSKLGKCVLLIDLDPQANATSGVGIDYNSVEKSIYEALIDVNDIKECIIEVENPDQLYLLPSSLSLAGASVELVGVENRETILKRKLNMLKSKFDYIIIDCPPSLGILTINGLLASDKVIIPVQAEYYALEGLGQLLNTIGLVQDNLNSDLAVLGAVVTMFDKRNRIAKQVIDELHNYFPYHVFKSIVPRNVRLTEAPSHGETIFAYEPTSPGARAYYSLGKELLDIY